MNVRMAKMSFMCTHIVKQTFFRVDGIIILL